MVGQLSFGNSRVKNGPQRVKNNLTSPDGGQFLFCWILSAAETSGIEIFRLDFPDVGPKSTLPSINYINIVALGVDSNQ